MPQLSNQSKTSATIAFVKLLQSHKGKSVEVSYLEKLHLSGLKLSLAIKKIIATVFMVSPEYKSGQIFLNSPTKKLL